MPKKRQSFQHTKPSSQPHPSLSSNSNHASDPFAASPSTKSVNEKLQGLRLEQRSAGGLAPLTDWWIPHSVQSLPQRPQGPAPRPRPGLHVTGGRRGLAGLPPPGSWMQGAANREKQRLKHDRERSNQSKKRIDVLPGILLPRAGSLLDQTLRALAANWEWHVHYDQYYLATLPIRYKEALLHYVAHYNQAAVNAPGLEVLFYDETELEGATGAVDLRHLDLSGATIGDPLSFKELKVFFTPPTRPAPSDVFPSDLPESWDAESSMPQAFPLPKFHTLTHLSLAKPTPAATWKDLLDFSPNLSSLTHLSLAYWPFPTLTPNMSTAYSTTPTGTVQAGGTSFYSEYDDEYSEAASLLRRLSKHTICLQWLDLTGCHPWTKCLSYRMIDWSGAWAGLETVKIGQGWLPRFVQENPEFRNRTLEIIFHRYMLSKSVAGCDINEELREIRRWSEMEADLQGIEKAVRARFRDMAEEAAFAEAQNSNPIWGHLRNDFAQAREVEDRWHDEADKGPSKPVARATPLHFEYASSECTTQLSPVP